MQYEPNKFVDRFKLLGVNFDRHLSFEKHAAEVKEWSTLNAISFLETSHFTGQSLLTHIFNFLCCRTWNTVPLFNLTMFQRLSHFKRRSASIKRQKKCSMSD